MITDETSSPPAARVSVKVVPGAKRDEIAGPLGERLKVRVAAPPEGGKANRAVCALIAEKVGVKVSAVSVIAGAGAAEKVLRIEGKSAAEVKSALGV